MDSVPQITEKRCTQCGVVKPLSEFPIGKRYAGGYRPQCCACKLANDADYRRRKGVTPLPVIRDGERKRCSRCGEWKLMNSENFHKSHRTPDGYAGKCRECAADYGKQHRSENATEYKHKASLKYQRSRDQIISKSRKYYADNKARRKQQIGDWKRFNAGKVRAYAERRRTRANLVGTFTADDVLIQYRSQRGKCWHCGKPVGDDYHVDHLIPLARGGTNDARNIVISCPFCNMSRGAKLPQEWNGRLF